MKAQTAGPLSIAGRACLTLCFVMLATGGSRAATVPIYKCFDKNLALVYTDEPCKNGELLDIRTGDADPAAVAWLERQRDALDQSAAQRLADQRRAALAVEFTPRSSYEAVDQGGAYDNAPVYITQYGLLSYPFMHRHRVRPRDARLRTRLNFAPPLHTPRRDPEAGREPSRTVSRSLAKPM